jgi:hypothetical protein
MHSFAKSGHFLSKTEIENYLNSNIQLEMITPIYPSKDCTAKELIELFKQHHIREVIFVHVNNLKYAEINMLCQYYKISKGVLKQSLSIICGDNQNNIIQWDSSYKDWSEMKLWELREWLSIFYPNWVQEWIDASQYIDTNWTLISTEEILSNTKQCFSNIIQKHGGFDKSLATEFDKFVSGWVKSQQYILDEYNLIEKILDSVMTAQSFTWNKISIISEAIIQQRLRTLGYEIKCYELDEFPTDSEILFSLLEKI